MKNKFFLGKTRMTNNTGIYVTGCVIANGIPDHENDILTKKDIKQIFTKFLEHQTDTEHNYLKNKGVDMVANWISEIDIDIKDKTAPAGSWLVTFYITNPELIKSIQSDEPNSVNGLSLGSLPKNVTDIEYWFINKSINYQDLKTTEDVIPQFISFVAKPSNGFGLLIEDYNMYINKSINEDDVEMTNKEEIPIEEDKLSVSGWERVIKGLQSLGVNKAETDATESDEEVEDEPTDITIKELAEKIDALPKAIATEITTAFEKMGKVEEPVEPVEKSEKEETEENDEEDEIVEPAEETKKAGINKSATDKEENIAQPNHTTSFYKKSGRTMFGCKK